MTKSYVSMETRTCIVCGEEYKTGSLLFNMRLANTLDEKTMVGMGMCPLHEKMMNEGYIAVIGVEKECANPIRTGKICHLRASMWPKIFNIPLPPNGVIFAPEEVMNALMGMISKGEEENVASANKNHES